MQTLLVADIGGTNARFAHVDPATHDICNIKTLQCADFVTADAAIRHYLDVCGLAQPSAMCLAVAGPCIDGDINVTNNHWSLSTSAMQSEFGIDAVRLVNDFEAVAYGIPLLGSDMCLPVGHDRVHTLHRDFSVAVIGPGTGFGVAGVVCRDGAMSPIIGEGGHVGFAPRTDLQIRILQGLMKDFTPVSVERLLSGPGIENIFAVLSGMAGDNTRLAAAKIFRRAEAGDALAKRTVAVFFEVMGQVAADVTLLLGAVDGLYIAGGISKRYEDRLLNSEFRLAFERVGKHEALMQTVPTYLIKHDEPGLLGAVYCVRELLA